MAKTADWNLARDTSLGRSIIAWKLSARPKAVTHGSMGIVARFVVSVDLAEEIDPPHGSTSERVDHRPAVRRVVPRDRRQLLAQLVAAQDRQQRADLDSGDRIASHHQVEPLGRKGN